jgi:hypothetical protein
MNTLSEHFEQINEPGPERRRLNYADEISAGSETRVEHAARQKPKKRVVRAGWLPEDRGKRAFAAARVWRLAPLVSGSRPAAAAPEKNKWLFMLSSHLNGTSVENSCTYYRVFLRFLVGADLSLLTSPCDVEPGPRNK